MSMTKLMVLAVAGVTGYGGSHVAAEPPREGQLIPRAMLFGNPERAAARLSPDGTRLAYLAPVNGVMNVWVGPVDHIDAAKPVTNDTSRGIRQYFWAYTSGHILYLQDVGGDENWKVYSVDLATGATKDLTPFEEILGPDGKPIMLPGGKKLRPAAQIAGVSERSPRTIVVGLNNRDPQYHDLYTVDIQSGEMKLLQQNDGYADFVVDDDYRVRFAARFASDGGNELLKADGAGGFAPWLKIDLEDTLTTAPLGFDKTGEVVYMADSRGRDTGALKAVTVATGAERLLAEDDRADVGEMLVHPTTKDVQAVAFTYDRKAWKVLDPSVEADLAYLRSVSPGEVSVTSRTLDDTRWTVAYTLDNGPAKTYLYDRGARKATFLFSNRPTLEGLPLVSMHPVVITARDGLKLVSYLSLPRGVDTDNDGRPSRPLPMVLNVHGGPWARDSWGFDPVHQWLANRGYAVMSVNFRGSTGFGKNFVNAGNKEWAGKMHDDLLDAVEWAVKEKVADPARVAIMGGSYGGYATLVGLTFTPDTFACGVDIVGPSNINTLLSTIPPYWAPAMELFRKRVGDNSTEDGRAFLEQRSPLTHVDKIKRPLLIGQGANDPRVKQSESDQIVKAMQEKKIPVTYVLYPDEGHGFARPENRLSFFAVTEAFLAQHLGGRYQEPGADFTNSSIQIPAGGDELPGIRGSLPKH